MAESQPASEMHLRMPSLGAMELGDLTTQQPDNEQQATAGASEAGPNQSHDQTSSLPTQPEDTVLKPDDMTSTSGDNANKHGLPPISIPPAAMTRTNTEAIGPSTDLPTPMLQPSSAALAAGPVIQFTLLLASTGTRHPYQINEKYLAKRNVSAQGADGKFDPASISVYTLKELILKDWREDWDSKPTSPSAIRLISFGQLLADNSSLKDCKLNANGAPNVLHVTVKPQEAIDEEEAAAKGSKPSMSRDRDAAERTPGCRCVIL